MRTPANNTCANIPYYDPHSLTLVSLPIETPLVASSLLSFQGADETEGNDDDRFGIVVIGAQGDRKYPDHRLAAFGVVTRR